MGSNKEVSKSRAYESSTGICSDKNTYRIYKKLKQSRYRPGVAQRFPGS
jgi:hypothetical protein